MTCRAAMVATSAAANRTSSTAAFWAAEIRSIAICSRRLAAARIVTAIGNWSQQGHPVMAPKKPSQSESTGRWQDAAVTLGVQERREPTYGTMGKFLGY